MKFRVNNIEKIRGFIEEKIIKRVKKTNGPHNSYQQYCMLEYNGARTFNFWGKKYFLPRIENTDRLLITSKSQQSHY